MTEAKAPKIVIKDVSKVFRLGKDYFQALDNVSLEVGESEFVTVVGPSGCGKSTMMNLLAGLITPSEGIVTVDGKEVDGPSPERGVIFQAYALFPWLTVRENVEFGLRSRKDISKAERRKIAEHFIEMVGLTQFADSLPKTLSGGMKQRCAIARAYAVNPSILLMDEPFGALDALTRVQLQSQLLDAWSQDKRTVMFITHDVDEAVFLANRVIVMAAKPGRIYDIIPIDLPYPRTDEMRLSPEFAELRNKIWKAVYHQDPNQTYDGPIGPQR
ncbi:nitrate ABC transporter, ATP-binding protein C and D [Gleimia coleocanis DSM 15436]|uniref:Nitrate ABC transporter, ATP-binding protein C and D n=1 Tax=Gleimia coleocanis DSM 15436 TaxID=525245 RepID=C0VYF4_9ACTO|nr:ABC transporter ATP-binding protein [Gleimia coleocanis]EEH64457.1 nitrate ABC transporter, ATP-binding protein C and D [Gleimia coleocanis DSM 15436]